MGTPQSLRRQVGSDWRHLSHKERNQVESDWGQVETDWGYLSHKEAARWKVIGDTPAIETTDGM